MTMPHFTSAQLEDVGRIVLHQLGTPMAQAELVSHSLVEANLLGHDSHGIMRLITYAQAVHAGQVKPAAQCDLTQTSGATAVVDGAYGWGQPAAQLASRTAVNLASQFGVGAVTITRCNHLGRLGEYVDSMARAGYIGIAMANVGSSVAPFGGRTRQLGTNPIAYAVPRGPGQYPVLVDFATSVQAEGKVHVARDKGQTLKPGVIIDKDGNPSTEPRAYYDGGALLAFGAHKGYGISVMCELIGGALSGMAPSCLPEFGGGNGTLLIALQVSSFVAPDQFADQTDRFSSTMKAAPTAPGVKAVLMPGDPEWTARRSHLEHGIDLPERTWNDILQLAQELNLVLPSL